jgi:hypothetical protein
MTSRKNLNDPVIDTYRRALAAAIDDMVKLFDEAQDLVENDELPLAIVGLLTEFDTHADNLKAALRLYANAMRRPK